MRAAPPLPAIVLPFLAACLLPVVAVAARPAAARAAPQTGNPTVTVYRCTDDNGRVTLRDTPCAKGQHQEARSMIRPEDAPPAPAPAAEAARPLLRDSGDAPQIRRAPAVVMLRAPQPMYECTTPDNQQYTSDSPEGNPRWVPMWTLGWPIAAGTWVRDTCRALPQAETCARLRDRRDEIDHRFFNAMPSERARLGVEERGLLARLDDECGGR
jgi:hypothetical protein